MMLDWYYNYQAYVIKLHQHSNKAIKKKWRELEHENFIFQGL